MSNNTCTKEDLLEGCYHEVGHLISASLFQPFSDRIVGIALNIKPNGARGAAIEFTSTAFNYKNGEYQGYKYLCLSGGVFQQMKLLKNQLDSGLIQYNLCEKILNCKDPKAASMHLYKRMVRIPFEGMEEDLGGLFAIQSSISEHFDEPFDINEERIKTIELLFPYINCPVIEKLCIDCRDYFWDMASACKNPILFSKERIDGYLQNENCALKLNV